MSGKSAVLSMSEIVNSLLQEITFDGFDAVEIYGLTLLLSESFSTSFLTLSFRSEFCGGTDGYRGPQRLPSRTH